MHAGDKSTCYTPCMAVKLFAKVGIEDVWSTLTPGMWLAMLCPPPGFHYCITIEVQLQRLQKQDYITEIGRLVKGFVKGLVKDKELFPFWK